MIGVAVAVVRVAILVWLHRPKHLDGRTGADGGATAGSTGAGVWGTAPGNPVGVSTVAVVVASAESAPAGRGSVMFETSVLGTLAFLLPLIGYPVLIIVQLIVETPILSREPATQHRRTAATVLAIVSLVAAAPLLVMAPALGAFAVLLLGGLVVPAVLTLMRLRQPPQAVAPL